MNRGRWRDEGVRCISLKCLGADASVQTRRTTQRRPRMSTPTKETVRTEPCQETGGRREQGHPDDHRQPQREDVRGPDPGRDDQGHGPPPDQGRGGRLRPHDLRPRLHEHRLVQEPDHVHRRGQGHPQLPRLPDRAARGAEQLPRDRLPAAERRAADEGAVRRLGGQGHDPHVRPREREGADGGLPLRRAPDGDAGLDGGRAQHLLPGRQEGPRRAGARPARLPADRQDPDPRRLRLPPLDGPAVRLPGQRAQLPRRTSCR